MMSKKTDEYVASITSAEDPLLYELYRETHLKMMYPRMLSGHVQGRFLEMISRMICPKAILEIGTFTGYSAICLARGLGQEGKLTTIEMDPEITEFAGRYIKRAGLADQVRQITGQALEIIAGLDEVWDLVFIDADKENYLNYFKTIVDRVRPGGFIIADNVLWGGKVMEPEAKQDKETRGIVEFNEYVKKDSRIDQVLLTVRDGLMLMRKI